MATVAARAKSAGDAVSQLTMRAARVLPRPGTRLLLVAIAALGYAGIFLLFYHNHPDVREFVRIGSRFLLQSRESQIIVPDPYYDYGSVSGYDGQFCYYIALDPANARYYVDADSYRYTRILYPILARFVALGKSDWVPTALIVVNFLAILGGTWVVASWLRLRRLSQWYALVYTFYIGQVVAFTWDLTEIVAYALVAGAVYVFDRYPQQRLWAAALFALAALGRETALLFPALYALAILLAPDAAGRRRLNLYPALLFGVVAALPAFLWQVFLYVWLGKVGLVGNKGLRLPFQGLLYHFPLNNDALGVVQAVMIPAVICVGVVAWAMWRDSALRGAVGLWLLLANALLFAIMLHEDSAGDIGAASRIGLGVVLSAIYCLPLTTRKTWFLIAAGLWLTATLIFQLNPAYAGSGG